MSKSAEGAELLTVHSNHGITRMGMTRTCQVRSYHNARSHPQPKAPSDLPAAAASFALAFSSPPFPRLSNKSHYQHHLLPPPASSLRYTLWPLPRPPSFCCSQLPVSWVAITTPTLAGRFYVIACGPSFYPARQAPADLSISLLLSICNGWTSKSKETAADIAGFVVASGDL
ncbi:unnamed protein product [Musa hybrid cultivar]